MRKPCRSTKYRMWWRSLLQSRCSKLTLWKLHILQLWYFFPVLHLRYWFHSRHPSVPVKISWMPLHGDWWICKFGVVGRPRSMEIQLVQTNVEQHVYDLSSTCSMLQEIPHTACNSACSTQSARLVEQCSSANGLCTKSNFNAPTHLYILMSCDLEFQWNSFPLTTITAIISLIKLITQCAHSSGISSANVSSLVGVALVVLYSAKINTFKTECI